MIEELREYYNRACRERRSLHRESTELLARLAKTEQELHTEELVGSDLSCRAARLEAAIRRERAFCDGLLGQGAVLADDFGPFGVGDAPVLDGHSSEPLTKRCAEILTAQLERIGSVREHSCRDYLRNCLREAGVPLESACLAPQAAPRTVFVGEQLCNGELQPLGEESDTDNTALGVPRWGQSSILRSHLDGVRCVLIDEPGGVLVSGGEDALVKAWELAAVRKGAPQFDELEPYTTLRGHNAPILALAYRPQDRILFSAGMDAYIRVWRLPEASRCSSYSPNVTSQLSMMRAGILLGHTDNVWSLDRHPHLPHLLSASADGSIGLWAAKMDAGSQQVGEMGPCFALAAPGRAASRDIPACAVWVPTNLTTILGGYSSSRVAIFDVRRENQVLSVLSPLGPEEASEAAQVTSACCHRVEQTAVVGHADRCARLIDLTSGKLVATYGGHGDAVTSVGIDPVQGHCVVTGCHDGCVRTFDMRTGRCRQTLRLHHAKYGEALHCVFHGARMLASAGADGNVVVLNYAE